MTMSLFDVPEVPAETTLKSVRIKSMRAVFESSPVVREDTPIYMGAKTNSAADVAQTFSFLRNEVKEHFICLHLDTKNNVACFDVVSVGSLSASIVHPREVFKAALLSSAASIILLHNHPSGDPTPSREDHEITKRLRECGDLLGIKVLDHVIIGDEHHVSFAERGLM